MLPAVPASSRLSSADRACIVLAAAIPFVWFLVYNGSRPDYLVDEGGHLGNIYHFLEHKSGWPEQMTMLPGYHFLVAALWQLHPPLKLLALARLVPTVTALLGLAAFVPAWRRIHGETEGVGRAALLFALLPIAQPFSALAYTDIPALAFALVAVTAHLAGHRVIAVVLFVAAVVVRQTNLLWAAFLLGWEFVRADAPRGRAWHRSAGLLLLLAVAASVVALTGKLTVGSNTGTAARFNPAVVHTGAWLLFLLGAPAWLAQLRPATRRAIVSARAHPLLAASAVALAIAAVVLLGLTYSNPHAWNRDLFWDGCTFTLLRNWPLVFVDRIPALRFASGVIVVMMAALGTDALLRQRHRLQLTLTFLAGAALPFANNLVEPRYFIPGFAFALLWLELSALTQRRLAVWWAVMCVAHAPFIARGLSLW